MPVLDAVLPWKQLMCGSRHALDNRQVSVCLLEDQLGEFSKIATPERPHVPLLRKLGIGVLHTPRGEEFSELPVDRKQRVGRSNAQPQQSDLGIRSRIQVGE